MSPNALEEKLRSLMHREGKLTFARFMELALFDPQDGYYASPERVGGGGDYYTSPCTHPIFGALLSLQFHEMWHVLGAPHRFAVIEAGAGSGLLAQSILEGCGCLEPAFGQGLRYIATDRHEAGSSGLRRSQKEGTGPCAVPQVLVASGIPLKGVVGCIVSNELLDALPVHRLTLREGKLLEIYVTRLSDSFTETLDEPSTPALQDYLERAGVKLQEGWVAEIRLEALDWVGGVAASLERGFVLTIDYGDVATRLYSALHPRGTLMCYYRHTATSNPHIRVGRQDITAHVDFTSLVRAGRERGMEPLGLVTQRDFLLNLGMDSAIRSLAQKGLPAQEYHANLLAMRELINPDGLGGFKVLIQARGASGVSLSGLGQDNPAKRLPVDVPCPLLDDRYIPLLKARYPHLALAWDDLWKQAVD